MLTKDENQVVRHFPKDPAKFEFDFEVAEVFEDMARRSIPLYEEAHDMHATLLEPWMSLHGREILDIGASRGGFLKALDSYYPLENHNVRATDNSEAMVQALARDYPAVDVAQVDITQRGFLNCMSTYDIINLTYVLQFIKPDLQRIVLGKVVGMLRRGGVLFIGQKCKAEGPIDDLLQERYIQWRVDNGYTREEIEAKTKALAGSMWPINERILIQDLKSFGITEVTRTCSWGPFSNLMCIKR